MKSLPVVRSLALLVAFGSSFSVTAAVTSASIIGASLSPQCLDYRVVGICYWLQCGPLGCKVRTSSKVRHYVPDAVVSSYANTGRNPWSEVSRLGPPHPLAEGGNDATTNHVAENSLLKFKEADVIGHPGGAAFSRFASGFGYVCPGAGQPLVPYLLSTLDALAWRHGIPESLYPEALLPGKREVGSTLSGDLWGNLYPRSGFLHQADDYKMAAVIAQRAGDITTRRGQVHVYVPLLAKARDGYWPAGELRESDVRTGKWQALEPRLQSNCTTFPHTGPTPTAKAGDYAWALWRPYACCQRRGQTFLGSTDFQ